MQQLHAYWRMDYIEAPRLPAKMTRPFTELPALGDDRAALIVHRTAHSYLILNRFPYNPGHLLAISLSLPSRQARLLMCPLVRPSLFDLVLTKLKMRQVFISINGFRPTFGWPEY